MTFISSDMLAMEPTIDAWRRTEYERIESAKRPMLRLQNSMKGSVPIERLSCCGFLCSCTWPSPSKPAIEIA
jgi:hypothetical protein